MKSTIAGGFPVSEYPIEIQGLRKVYGSFTAVDGLDLCVKRNSFTGLLGPNGAGKSTTLKILTNLQRPTEGSVCLNGIDVSKEPKEALKGVGTVVETPEFYQYLTPKETFSYIGDILGMSKEAVASETDAILEEVKMTEWADKRLGTFSKGMRQRISIGLSLLGSPDIIILDEPTSGLDPRGMAEMRDILKNIRNNNHDLTVLMSSHMMYEVSDLCDRVALVNHGKLILHDDIFNVMGAADHRTVIIKLRNDATEDNVSQVAGLTNVASAERSGSSIKVALKGGKDEESLLFRQLAELDIGVYSMSESQNALEERYLELIKESRRYHGRIHR